MCDSRECAGGTDFCCEIDCTQWSGFRTDGDWRPPMANRPCPLGDQCPSEECMGSTAADCGGGCTFIPAGSDPACVYTAGHDQQRLGLAAGERFEVRWQLDAETMTGTSDRLSQAGTAVMSPTRLERSAAEQRQAQAAQRHGKALACAQKQQRSRGKWRMAPPRPTSGRLTGSCRDPCPSRSSSRWCVIC